MILNEQNFLTFAARHYINENCTSDQEFLEDLNRIKYLKKLFYHYKNKGVLRERLILNHIIVLYNTFDPRACTKMLFFKLHEYWDCLAPFLIMLGFLPPIIRGIENEENLIHTDKIQYDLGVVSKIREIRGETQ